MSTLIVLLNSLVTHNFKTSTHRNFRDFWLTNGISYKMYRHIQIYIPNFIWTFLFFLFCFFNGLSRFSHHSLPVTEVTKQLSLHNVNTIASRPKIQPEKYYYTKFILEQVMKPGKGVKYNSTLSLTSALDWNAWTAPSSGRFTLGKDIWYPF
jgi:hypothetical protein